MAAKLKRLVIDRVDLVDKGANPDAHIVLFKRDVAKNGDGVPYTTQEILDHDARRQAWSQLRWAFMDSLESIMEHASADEQAPLLLTSVEEFANAARSVLSAMALPDDTYKRAMGGVEAVEKAGRVIAGQRLQRLKQAVTALQAIINEAEPEPKMKPNPIKHDPVTMDKGAPDMAELDDITKRATDAEAQVAKLQLHIATLEVAQGELTKEIAKLQPADPWQGVSVELRKRIEASEERVTKAETEVRKRDCIGQVRKYDKLPINPDDHWEMFDKLNALPEDIRKKVYELLDSAQEVARQSGLFTAQGSNGPGDGGGGAYAKMDAQAREMVTNGVVKTVEQGMDRVMQEQPELYARYEAERRGA